MKNAFEVQTGSGLRVYGPNTRHMCQKYLAQALTKGSELGFLSVVDAPLGTDLQDMKDALKNRALDPDDDVIVIDAKQEYGALAKALGGEVVQMEEYYLLERRTRQRTAQRER